MQSKNQLKIDVPDTKTGEREKEKAAAAASFKWRRT